MKKNSIEEIDRLGKLLEKGLITEEEFKSLKNKTLKSSSDKGSPFKNGDFEYYFSDFIVSQLLFYLLSWQGFGLLKNIKKWRKHYRHKKDMLTLMESYLISLNSLKSDIEKSDLLKEEDLVSVCNIVIKELENQLATEIKNTGHLKKFEDEITDILLEAEDYLAEDYLEADVLEEYSVAWGRKYNLKKGDLSVVWSFFVDKYNFPEEMKEYF